ncbi:MAG: carbohydrate ABC transporter permease [Anaerolineales bacterium]|nr:carbohydrate ABC transporter permease [Anaerolineales bacterium]
MMETHRSASRPWRKVLTRSVQYAVLTGLAFLVVVPVVMLAFSGLKSRGEAFMHPYAPPIPPDWTNVVEILGGSAFWTMLRNSTVVMAAATFGVLVVSSLAAFVFARMTFRRKPIAFNLLMLGLMFPINIAILPVYLLIRQLDLTNHLAAVILVQIAFNISGNIMILRSFFATVPFELQDASAIDGCTTFDFYWRILLPIARPALSAVAALTMIISWNDLLVPLVMIDEETLWTLPLGTMQFQGQYGMDFAKISAFTALTILPTILFYLLAERQIVAGMASGAVKG